ERNRGGGRGLKIVRSVVDDLIVESDDAGTTASFTLDLDGVAKTYV
ncbi:MAG: hypothetical protein QOC57_1056, partial [Ilumatobacteraceae bacterium]